MVWICGYRDVGRCGSTITRGIGEQGRRTKRAEDTNSTTCLATKGGARRVRVNGVMGVGGIKETRYSRSDGE